MTKRTIAMQKPILKPAARSTVLDFAEGRQGAPLPVSGSRGRSSATDAPKGLKSGLIPEGDARLTANIRGDLHMRLKMRAVQERTTIGELIEQWVESWPNR